MRGCRSISPRSNRVRSADRPSQVRDGEAASNALWRALGSVGAIVRSTGAEFEELEAATTEDEIAAEKAAAGKTLTVRERPLR